MKLFLLLHVKEGILFKKKTSNHFPQRTFFKGVIMEILKKICLGIGALVLAGFALRIVFSLLGAVFSLLFSVGGLILLAAIAIPIYLIADRKLLR